MFFSVHFTDAPTFLSAGKMMRKICPEVSVEKSIRVIH